MHTELLTAVLKTCPRCGQTFETSGGVYLCQSCKQPKITPRACDKALTFREKQIIHMVYEAKLNKEIAYDLHLSEGTIKEYLHRIFRKLGVRNRTDLALWSLAHQEEAA